MSKDSDAVIICLLDSDDEDDESNTLAATRSNNRSSRVSSKKENIENETARSNALKHDEDDDDEVEIVEKVDDVTTTKPAAAGDNNKTGGTDEELQIVGTANEQKFPHSRQDCLEFRYVVPTGRGGVSSKSCGVNGGNDNAKFCSLCYCYVCDDLASKCDNWFRGSRGVCSSAVVDTASNITAGGAKTNNDNKSNKNFQPHKNHCHAREKGPYANLWKNMRRAVKDGRDPSKVTNDREEVAAGPNGRISGSSGPHAFHQMLETYYASHMPGGNGMGGRRRGASSARNRIAAAMLGRERQQRASRVAASAMSIYGSSTQAAARAAAGSSSRGRSGRSRSAPARSRRSGPAAHDHRTRIRTQQMLEDLYN